MSISHSLSNALSGMTAASRLAEVISSNIANSLTDGYGRRQLDLSAATIGGRGAGVEIGGVNRLVDRGVLGDRRLADADLGRSSALVDVHARIEKLIGAPGAEVSLSGRIASLEESLVDVASDPSSDVRLGVLANRLTDLAGALNEASDGVQQMRAEADADIASQVEALNTSLKQVETLNADITYAINSGQDASGLMDKRQQVIDRIAQIVPVRELDRQGAQVALMTPAGEMLIDGPAKTFGFVATPVITPDMTLAGGGLSGMTLDGAPLAADGIGKLDGGTLGAAFEARDGVLVQTQDELDALAADLVTRFASSSVDPTLGPPDAGLFTDAGGAFDPLNTVGLAGRISVNTAVDTAQGGDLWRLRDGLNAPAAGEAGDATLLQALTDALSNPLPLAPGGAPRGVAGHAAALEAKVGSARLAIEAEQSFTSARWDSLKTAEAAGGVDTDYEMQMLLRVEQAYSANARLVQTVESMLQTLMEL